MRSVTLFLVALLIGCHPGESKGPPPPPTAAATTQPALQPVELHYVIELARLDVATTVTSDGRLRSVRTENKSYGWNDIGGGNERFEIREGRLTPQRIEELVHLFDGWESLSSNPYGGVADGGALSVRYGGKTVSGGSGVPPQVNEVRVRLEELSRGMPVVNP